MQRLYVDEMGYKLERGLQEVKFHDIYDEWVKILRERGVYHPIWNHEDMEFVKTMISGNSSGRGIAVIQNRRIGIFLRMSRIHPSRY